MRDELSSNCSKQDITVSSVALRQLRVIPLFLCIGACITSSNLDVITHICLSLDGILLVPFSKLITIMVYEIYCTE